MHPLLDFDDELQLLNLDKIFFKGTKEFTVHILTMRIRVGGKSGNRSL
jgi:hypothetical protein